MRREEVMVGILAATIENFSMGAPKKAAQPSDFMLHPYPPKPVAEQIWEQFSAYGRRMKDLVSRGAKVIDDPKELMKGVPQ
jgi:hypothetical protein